jgi:hypothetical protein
MASASGAFSPATAAVQPARAAASASAQASTVSEERTFSLCMIMRMRRLTLLLRSIAAIIKEGALRAPRSAAASISAPA